MTSANLNVVSVSALLSVVVSLIAAAGAWVLGRAPDWGDVRPLARVGLTAGLAAGCSVAATIGAPPAFHVWSNRLQMLALALHAAAWYAYLLQWAGPLSARRRALAFGPLLAAGLVALVPGAVYTDGIAQRAVPWLGVVYHDPVPAPLGFAVMTLILCYAALGVVWIAARERGIPNRRAHLLVTASILAMGIHDAVLVGGLALPTPYLIDFAMYLPAITVALTTLRRVAATATDLRRLRTGLEVAVVERTHALERSQAALAVSERLAALGQFAGGFAREVEHPVKVAEANLEALGRELGGDPRDRVWARLGDTRAALARIGTLARQLLVAGRAAATPAGPVVDVRLGHAVDVALARGQATASSGHKLGASVAPGLTVSAHEDEVVEVLTTLVVDALGRLPAGRGGAVTVRAEPAGARVRISVEDDGAALSEEALRHAFEPFHETEPRRGSGLRLAVARGLVEGMGGTIRLERGTERGTRAMVDLAGGAPDVSAADLPQAPVAAPRRARILVADADPRTVRVALGDLAREHEVEAVTSVAAALAALADRTFDVVLCDAGLPGGGGERLWEELLLRFPSLQGRVAFLVAGAEPPPTQAFLDRQPQPVLQKPLGLADLAVLLDWLGLGGPAAPGRTPLPRPVGRLRGA